MSGNFVLHRTMFLLSENVILLTLLNLIEGSQVMASAFKVLFGLLDDFPLIISLDVYNFNDHIRS